MSQANRLIDVARRRNVPTEILVSISLEWVAVARDAHYYVQVRSSQAAISTPMNRTPLTNFVPGSTCMLRLPMGIATRRMQVHEPSASNLNARQTKSSVADSVCAPEGSVDLVMLESPMMRP